MFNVRSFLSTALSLAALSTLTAGEEVIFADNFDRADAEDLGNEWASKGAVVLKNKSLLFQAKEEEFRPRTKRSFPIQKSGKFTVTFLMDWLRVSEGTWGFYMQLGDSEAMAKRLVYLQDLSKGIGINLIWGGGELVSHQKTGSFGYARAGEFKPLFVVNDRANKESVVPKPLVTIEVDVDAKRYAITFNGKTYPNLPFDHDGPIDTIRFIANGCSESGFSKSAIDDFKISKKK